MEQLLNTDEREFFSGLIADPEKVDAVHAPKLKTLVELYPQSAVLRALLARASQVTDQGGFQQKLKSAAVYVPDRAVLYNLINYPEKLVPYIEPVTEIVEDDVTSYYENDDLTHDENGNPIAYMEEPVYVSEPVNYFHDPEEIIFSNEPAVDPYLPAEPQPVNIEEPVDAYSYNTPQPGIEQPLSHEDIYDASSYHTEEPVKPATYGFEDPVYEVEDDDMAQPSGYSYQTSADVEEEETKQAAMYTPYISPEYTEEEDETEQPVVYTSYTNPEYSEEEGEKEQPVVYTSYTNPEYTEDEKDAVAQNYTAAGYEEDEETAETPIAQSYIATGYEDELLSVLYDNTVTGYEEEHIAALPVAQENSLTGFEQEEEVVQEQPAVQSYIVPDPEDEERTEELYSYEDIISAGQPEIKQQPVSDYDYDLPVQYTEEVKTEQPPTYDYDAALFSTTPDLSLPPIPGYTHYHSDICKTAAIAATEIDDEVFEEIMDIDAIFDTSFTQPQVIENAAPYVEYYPEPVVEFIQPEPELIAQPEPEQIVSAIEIPTVVPEAEIPQGNFENVETAMITPEEYPAEEVYAAEAVAEDNDEVEFTMVDESVAPQPISEPDKPVNLGTKITPDKNTQPGNEKVARYNDDKMPYSFLWWLGKVRKEHAETHQPYVAFKPVISEVARPVSDELQQQYFENIFHITSVEQLDLNTRDKQKESEIIDRFIQQDPQMKPPNTEKLDNENKAKRSAEDKEDMVTETLARIYTDQMLYPKAIATYQKLMLKFPEKSSYFVARIKTLQKKIN